MVSISSKFDSVLSAIVSLIMFLSDDLISPSKSVCSESLSEESISAVSKHALDLLYVDSLSVYSSDLLYELNKDYF